MQDNHVCIKEACAPLEVRCVPVKDVILDPKNARRHDARQIDQIVESISAFGFNVPVLIDKDNKVIAGHGRVLASKKLGYKVIPTIQLEHLTPAQARAFAIADNKLTDNSEWDDRLLAESLKELASLDLEFGLEATGFTMGEIDFCIGNLDIFSEGSNEVDNMPALPESAISQAGDLWKLGNHRILCGSAVDESAYDALLSNRKADVVFTDPPYNVPIDGHVSGNGDARHREFAMASGEMTETEFTEFLTVIFKTLAVRSKPGSLHYICMDWRHVFEITKAGRAAYNELKNICVWAKDKGGMGSLYRSQHEFVFVFKQGQARHRNNVQLGQYGRNRTNVWEYPGANTLIRQSAEGDLLTVHPTVKPVMLVADAILDCSVRNDMVLDVFLGSGTTLLAAERTGRVCYGMEIDPVYVDASIHRWQDMTGLKAVHATAGKTFDELTSERSGVLGGTVA